jgi:NAD(P)-dependent dehydrogenase (short-subunit alcohol dehydrogenase family)
MVCDVRDWDAVQQAVAHVEAELGPIDRVTNAAAIAPTAPLLEQPVETIHRLMDINYLGTVHVTKAALPAMVERGHGDLINYASLAGWLPSPGFGAYSATKFAVVAFTETLAHEIAGRGVRVACVCPPIVDTPLLDQVGEGAQDLLDTVKAIRPEQVLDAIERSIDKGELFVWPTFETKVAQLVRRLAPSVFWKRMDQITKAASLAGRGPRPATEPSSVPDPEPDPGGPEPADTGTAPARG